MVRPRAPAWALLASLLVALAGCAGPAPQPPAPGPPTGLALQALPASVTGGSMLEANWTLVGGAAGVTASEIHYGPVSQATLAAPSYPNQAAGTRSGDGYTAKVTVPAAAGTLYLRAHAVANGKDLWSEERSVAVATAPPSFQDVKIPDGIEAGVPFLLSYRLVAAGSSSHIGAHFAEASSAALPAHFAPADWPNVGKSDHIVANTSLPTEVKVNVTLPKAGTWYLRPHANINGTDWWGAERTLTVAYAKAPNIVLLTEPAQAIAGQAVNVTFQLNAPEGTSSSHVGSHFSNVSSAGQSGNWPPSNWSGFRTGTHVTTSTPLPGQFTTSIVFPLPGTWYYRAHAAIGAQNVWSKEVMVKVQPPAEPRVVILEAPANHTIRVNPLTGAEFSTINVTWAVLVPGANVVTNHTDLHHGPQSVQANETAPGSQSSPDQHGPVPGLFTAAITPTGVPANGPYYLRAMAMLPNAEGKIVEVWSEERVVTITVQA